MDQEFLNKVKKEGRKLCKEWLNNFDNDIKKIYMFYLDIYITHGDLFLILIIIDKCNKKKVNKIEK